MQDTNWVIGWELGANIHTNDFTSEVETSTLKIKITTNNKPQTKIEISDRKFKSNEQHHAQKD